MLFDWGTLVVEFYDVVSGQQVCGFVRDYGKGRFGWSCFFEDDQCNVADAGMSTTMAEAMLNAELFCAKELGMSPADFVLSRKD